MYESHDGQARVSLHHALGHLQHPPQHHSREEQYRRQSPSRLRRRVRRAMARSAATAANKETSVNDDAALDTSKHVIDAVQAESTQTNILSVDDVKADGDNNDMDPTPGSSPAHNPSSFPTPQPNITIYHDWEFIRRANQLHRSGIRSKTKS